MSTANGNATRVNWIKPTIRNRPGGLRAGLLADYQVVCGVGDYEIDVLVREIETPRRLEIGGQLTVREAVYEPAPDVPVQIVEEASDLLVDQTKTDPFGEFHLASPSAGRIGVRLGEEAEAPCVLLWPLGDEA